MLNDITPQENIFSILERCKAKAIVHTKDLQVSEGDDVWCTLEVLTWFHKGFQTLAIYTYLIALRWECEKTKWPIGQDNYH